MRARPSIVAGLLLLSLALGACRSGDGSSSPVLGAVFGLGNAGSVPYTVGRIPDPTVRPTDKVIGDAANNPGQCIFQRPSGARFRANCPDGYAIGDNG